MKIGNIKLNIQVEAGWTDIKSTYISQNLEIKVARLKIQVKASWQLINWYQYMNYCY